MTRNFTNKIIKKTGIIFFIMLAMVTCVSQAFAYQFMADYVEIDHGVKTEGKLFKGERATRFEIKSGKKRNTIQVTRYDKGLIWLLDLEKKTYQESHVPNLSNIFGTNREPVIVAKGTNFTRDYVGEEKIDSYSMRKFVVKSTYNFKGESVSDVYYEWYRTDFPLPVKTSSIDGAVTTEYKNIMFRKLDPAMFERPKGFKKILPEEN